MVIANYQGGGGDAIYSGISNELFYKIKYQEGASHNTAAIKKNPNEPASPSSSRDRSAREAMRNWVHPNFPCDIFILFLSLRSLLVEYIFLQTELVFWNMSSYFCVCLEHYSLDILCCFQHMDKNISVAEEIVEHMTLMQISGHLQVKLLEDQVRICMSAVKFGMQVYSQSRTLM
ncbi:uncharacterized protein LOC125550995 [Triticum urartu]|uniref:uncharacterized protein LOC125550995 n=1 Tax=Triticum urartu TaxID=4572 RepID=UPI002044A19E|nr:uncharacterized protein LOC125550995 [Triticum urartu]